MPIEQFLSRAQIRRVAPSPYGLPRIPVIKTATKMYARTSRLVPCGGLISADTKGGLRDVVNCREECQDENHQQHKLKVLSPKHCESDDRQNRCTAIEQYSEPFKSSEQPGRVRPNVERSNPGESGLLKVNKKKPRETVRRGARSSSRARPHRKEL